MALIKSYTMCGVSYEGVPYTITQDFNQAQVGNRCHFDPVHGIPRNVAEDLVAGWNRTTELYARQDPAYRKPTYQIVEMPDEPQCTSTAKSDIKDNAMAKIFNREGAIEALVDNDKDYILNGDGGGIEWLENRLELGHTGYRHQLDHELLQDCMERDIPEDRYWTSTNNG